MKINKNKFFHYFLIFIAFIFVLYYMWFRFFRERLPRNIPFDLSVFSFLILLSLCIFYFFLIYKIYNLRKKSNDNFYFFQLFFYKIQFLFKPFILLHNFFLVDLNFNKIFTKYFSFILKKYKLYNETNNLKSLLLLDFFPKCLILFVFILCVFYFKNLNLFYYVLFLGLIPLIYNYCAIICATSLEVLLQNLEKYYYIEILSTFEEETQYKTQVKFIGYSGFMCPLYALKYNDEGFLNLRYFVEWQAQNYIYEYDLYKYTCVETEYAKELYAEKHNIILNESNSKKISQLLKDIFFENIEKAIFLQAFFEAHKDISKITLMKRHSIIILLGYLIIWIYILIVSFHTLDLQEILILLQNIQIHIEPFSEIELKYDAY